jgi:hypothetical protein
MDNIIVVKVVILEESLPQGIEGEVISVYTIKSIFDGMKKTYGRIVTIEYNPNRNAYICNTPPLKDICAKHGFMKLNYL